MYQNTTIETSKFSTEIRMLSIRGPRTDTEEISRQCYASYAIKSYF